MNNDCTLRSSVNESIFFRKAAAGDVSAVAGILAIYAAEGLLLPLTEKEIAERITSFYVAVDSAESAIVACAAFKDFGGGLFELRSLAVRREYAGRKIGSALVEFMLEQADIPSGSRIFALTYRTGFFQRLGFSSVSKARFPEKIWHDCDNCPKKDHCDEQAVLLIR